MDKSSAPRRSLPTTGFTRTDVFSQLDQMSSGDVRWRDGQAFSLAYCASPEVLEVAEEAYRRFSGANALNTAAFPSLRQMQTEVLEIAAGWLGAPAASAGYFTSGGTESILMAVKSARDQFLAQRHITSPNIVLPISAHAAFDKACAYFGVQIRRAAVQPDWRADVHAMADLIDADTVMLVGSAPQYPQGVIDDIAAIGSLALQHGINCHVDACMGGVSLAYLHKLGFHIPIWDLSTPGTTSISVDLHKFGYTSKGASVIMYADKNLRSYQGFVTDNWLGGTYASSGMLGTKSGGPIASAWAVMHFLGDDGYLNLTQRAKIATDKLADAIRLNPFVELLASPDALLLAFAAVDASQLDVFSVAQQMWDKGWYLDRQQPPPSLHCTINAVHHDKIEMMISDLNQCIESALNSTQSGDAGQYGTLT